jgi:integrase
MAGWDVSTIAVEERQMTRSRNSTIRLRYVQAWVDRDGRAHYYFRRKGCPLVRLPGLPGSADRAYEAALEEPKAPIGAEMRSLPGSISAVIAAYYDSGQFFGSKAAGTKAMRRAILERFRARHGDKPIALIPPKFIKEGLDGLTPHAARNCLKTLRSLFQFAVAREWMCEDPTRDIKLPAIKSDGYHTWTEEEIAQFEAHHPVGSKARLALALLVYTGQRPGDVRRMGRQHIRDGVLTVRQEKTGTTIAIPVLSELQAILDATPSEHLTFLVTPHGQLYGGTNFSTWFRAQCDAASLPKECSAHGLRRSAISARSRRGWPGGGSPRASLAATGAKRSRP